MGLGIIINKDACNDCNMCCGSVSGCCCECKKSCAGRWVCPIFNYSPSPVKKKERMSKGKLFKKMFNETFFGD